MKKIFGKISTVVAYLRSAHFLVLLLASAQPEHLARHRTNAIVDRLQLISIVFGVLTLAWIPLDMFSFERDQWMILGGMRLIIAINFFVIAWASRDGLSHGAAMFVVFLVLANPMIIHAVAHILLGGSSLTGLSLVNQKLYGALPYVVVAGLALFPLVALESLVLFVPVALAEQFLTVYTGSFFWVDAVSQVWILGLLLGVAVLAGMVQTYYMEVLLKRADHDPLTGAITRRSGTEMMDFMFRLAVDKASPLTIVFLDIDDFKSINDAYGHDEGDEALRKTVISLNEKMRDADTVIRWGGEEFVLLLPETSLDGSRMVIDRILSDWLTERPDGKPLTASIGVAERLSDAKETWSDLVELADQRMYEAKQSGKATCVWE